ncbi:MAG: Gfo/Idh/MocA family oxidoreductase [Phycisphaerales bacterium]|nr:Gfo/Idh/MocA family oxidoreductase [Phycisphaerales bacterium]
MSQAESTSNPVRVAVIGCGRMGKLHARVYSQMPSVKLVGVYDANLDTAHQIANQYDCIAVDSPEQLYDQVQAVSIAVPTIAHLATAEPLLRRGIACLIEKPLARNSQEGARIAALSREFGAIAQAGHIERFNPAFRALAQMKLQPRFLEVVRVSPMTFRSIDVGVVLDMMIHDIDIVLSLAGSPVTAVEAVGVSVLGTSEDICNARLVFANGCVANLTASRLALKTERRLRAFSHDAYVSLDYQKKYGLVVKRSGNLEAIRSTVARIRSGEISDLTQLDFQSLVDVQELPIEDAEPLRSELDAFISAVRGEIAPVVSAQDGLAAVQVAEQIVAAIEPQKL